MAKIDWKNTPQQDPIDPLTDMDPQSAAAIPGMRSMLGNAVNSETVEGNDAILPDYNSPIEAVGAAIPGIGMGMARDASEVVGNEIGAIGRNVKAAQPKTYYHATTSNFDKIDPSKFSSEPTYGKGFYLAHTPEAAEEYVTVPGKQIKLGRFETKIADKANMMPFELTSNNHLDLTKPLPKDVLEHFIDEAGMNKADLKKYSTKPGSELFQDVDGEDLNRGRVSEYLKSKGYDGMADHDQTVVFDPENIKSKFGQPSVTDSISKGLSYVDHSKADAEAKQLMQQYAEEQRIKRAKDQGFDTETIFYHGSPNPEFEEFSPKLKGSTTGQEDAKLGYFFTKGKSNAEGYRVLTKENIEKYGSPGDAFMQAGRAPEGRGHVLEARLKMKNPMFFDNYDEYGEATNEAIAESIKEAKKNGHDSLVIPEHSGGHDTVIVFEPHQIRKTSANFDPKKVKSGKLSYAEGGKVFGSQPEILTDEQINALSSKSPKEATQPEFMTDDQMNAMQVEHDKNSDFGSQVQTGLEGAARGALGPLAPMAEQAGNYLLSGQSAEQTNKNIRAREEANPTSAHIGEALGMGAGIWTGSGVAGGISKAANLIKAGEGAGLAAKVGAAAVRGAVENAALQGSDEAAKMIEQDPNQSAQTALTHVGLAGLLGGGLGGSFELAHGALNKLGQVAADFKGRLGEHLSNPEPEAALHQELTDHYNGVKEMADNVYGGTNLKKQDILKVMPEASTKMAEQVSGLTTKVDEQLEKMMGNENRYPPQLSEKLGADVAEYKKAIQAAKSPGDLFEATQELKQNLYAYAKFEKQTTRLDPAYDFVKDVKGLGHEFKTALEDKKIWSKAAERQQAINAANTEFAPALKDFEKKFTTEVGGETVIDPAKIATFVKQLGKPQAEIKQEMLSNFLKASEKYKKVIAESHANLGLESPLGHTSLHHAYSALEKPTLGGRLADIVVHKGLGEAGGKGAGAAVGAMIGHHIGIGGEVGALVGQHALGPFFSSVLPALAKPLLNAASHATAFQHAADYAASVAKGERLATKVTENLFKDGTDAMKGVHIPTDKELSKLDKVLEGLQVNANGLLNIGGQVGHYLPDHVPAMAQTADTAVQFLNSQRPQNAPVNPLDPMIPTAPYQDYEYKELLKLAEQPLIAIGKIQKGTITHKHVQALQTMYPDLYKGLSQKLTNGMITARSKKQLIPYPTKLGLSVFMGQPLDSTMSWSSIQSTQAATMGKGASQPGQEQPSKPPAASSTKELTKAPAANRTPSQAIQYNQQTKD